ncbi:hypothetical protein Tco_0448841 [Tanacetum coccineum]
MAGDGVTNIKRRRRDQSSDGVRIMATVSGRGRLKEDLESSTWRWRQEHKATPTSKDNEDPSWSTSFKTMRTQKTSSALEVENSKLVAMFWADEVSKCNYKEFGDIVSFDATFNSNNNEKKKNHDIDVIPKRYVLRRWIRDTIPHDLRRQRNRYGENVTIERLTNEANFLVDDCLFLLSKDEEKMGAFVEKLKLLKDEVKADAPNPSSRNTGDVIGGERLKSEREKALKVRAKAMKVCGYCNKKTNEHTKITCPKNPKARKKRMATPTIDV